MYYHFVVTIITIKTVCQYIAFSVYIYLLSYRFTSRFVLLQPVDS